MLKNHLIDPNGKLYRLGIYLVDFFILNMLFILTCLPIVTIGSSLVALASVSRGMIDEKVTSPLKSYVNNFRSCFLRGMAIQLYLAITGLVLYVGIAFFKVIPYGASIFVGIGLLIAVINFFAISILIFPYTARYDNGFFQVLKWCFK